MLLLHNIYLLMTHKAYEIIVSGVVQGVGFRYFTRQAAQRIGIFGTVINLSSGQVKITAEGTEKQLMDFIDWCHAGPDTATVESLDYKEGRVEGYDAFKIIR